MGTVPKSKQFDDVYFSVEDGLAETRHVFLDGNGLPNKWIDTDRFVICEAGFGTGLNFLAAWKLFSETVRPDQKLHFISFEKFPLTAPEIEHYLAHWKDDLGDRLFALVKKYPEDTTGIREIRFGEHITLTLIFGDVNDEILKLEAEIDAWFLDGFKPASNPDMWSEILFSNMARLSKAGTSFATFTAAGFVRRRLQAAGFHAEKVKGYGRKREMLTGTFQA